MTPDFGTFNPTATGFEGTIATLMTNKMVRFVANEKKKAENSPDYFLKSDRSDLSLALNNIVVSTYLQYIHQGQHEFKKLISNSRTKKTLG